MKRIALAVVVLAVMLQCASALADDPPQCAYSSGGASSDPPSGRVVLKIISMRLNSDMEPDYPFYDNRADVFGKISIDADGVPEPFSLPEISESDFPHWTSGNRFLTRPAPVGRKVHVVIHLEENDWGATGFNDMVDTSPNSARDDLEFDFDTCALTVSGDITGSASAPIPVKSGTAGNQGTLLFSIGMDGQRALSTRGDVVLQGFDLIQVLPEVSRMVAKKPAVGLVTVANNTPAKQPVSVRLRVIDEANTLIYDATESLGADLEVGEVRSMYLGTSHPIVPSDFSCKPSRLSAMADLILAPGTEDPGNPKVDCWVINNSSGVKQWDVATTRAPRITWVRTGHLLSATSLASMTQLQNMRTLAMPFIRGVYPVSSVSDNVSSIGLVPPLSGGLYGFIASLLAALGVPADAATPYAMVAELDAIAALANVDRLMGVLPKDWFDATLYGLLDGVTGLSLGEWMQRAVIFEVESSSDDHSNVGPRLALPAHELGHTYGLSLDPTIKSAWCNLPGNLGVIACGVAGGFDEYHSDSHSDGVLTWGYWVPQSSGAMLSKTGQQCPATCMMGSNFINAQNGWLSRPSWIDAADYDRLIDRLTSCRAPASAGWLYVSGVIAADDSMHFGWTFYQADAQRTPDFADKPGEYAAAYGIVLLDAKGNQLAEAELPLNWKEPEGKLALQATFFGGYVRFPADTAKIQVWSRVSKKLLGERIVSARVPSPGAPSVKLRSSGKERFLDVVWSAKDGDGDKLTHFIQLSPDAGANWWPATHALEKSSASLDVTDLARGMYTVRVLSSDGVNVGAADATLRL